VLGDRAPTVVGQTGVVAVDENTFARIEALVAEEKELRAKREHGQIDQAEEQARLRAVESELDQCWDLLRQRRALRETGRDPREATVRPKGQVEGYLG
jgi:hypothetical protein